MLLLIKKNFSSKILGVYKTCLKNNLIKFKIFNRIRLFNSKIFKLQFFNNLLINFLKKYIVNNLIILLVKLNINLVKIIKLFLLTLKEKNYAKKLTFQLIKNLLLLQTNNNIQKLKKKKKKILISGTYGKIKKLIKKMKMRESFFKKVRKKRKYTFSIFFVNKKIRKRMQKLNIKGRKRINLLVLLDKIISEKIVNTAFNYKRNIFFLFYTNYSLFFNLKTIRFLSFILEITNIGIIKNLIGTNRLNKLNYFKNNSIIFNLISKFDKLFEVLLKKTKKGRKKKKIYYRNFFQFCLYYIILFIFLWLKFLFVVDNLFKIKFLDSIKIIQKIKTLIKKSAKKAPINFLIKTLN